MTTETPTTNQADIVGRYVQLRDLRAAKETAHKAELAKIDEAMDRIERHLLEQLNAAGASSVATPAGTFFKQETTQVKADDWGQVLDFIRKNEAWHMLNKVVNKTAVMEYVEEHEDLPPGVSLRRETVLRVHRA